MVLLTAPTAVWMACTGRVGSATRRVSLAEPCGVLRRVRVLAFTLAFALAGVVGVGAEPQQRKGPGELLHREQSTLRSAARRKTIHHPRYQLHLPHTQPLRRRKDGLNAATMRLGEIGETAAVRNSLQTCMPTHTPLLSARAHAQNGHDALMRPSLTVKPVSRCKGGGGGQGGGVYRTETDVAQTELVTNERQLRRGRVECLVKTPLEQHWAMQRG